MNESDVSLFSFNKETSFITYKKVSFKSPVIETLSKQQKYTDSQPSYFYDKYTNQFIYINSKVIIVLDTKGKIKNFSRIELNEKIKSISLEYNNKYILLATVDYKCILINLEDLEKIENIDNKKMQYLGGFFIPYKTPEKNHDYFILCLINKNNFNIKRILKIKSFDNSFKYSNKTNYISNKMKIIDFNFNHIFKVLLIIKSNPASFVIFNLKSKNCYKVPISINIDKLNENEYKLYLEKIYEKLYFIHLNNSRFINIYRLNNLKKMKSPRKIKFNKNFEGFKITDLNLHFYNNLIILYMPNYIKIYDIKSKSNNFEIAILNITENDYKILINSFISGKYLLINNEFYKIKFSKIKYKKYSNSISKEIFFSLLRRKNSNYIIKLMLFDYLNNYKIWNFFEILEEIIIKNKKYNSKIKENIIEEKNNYYIVKYIGNNQFFLAEDYLFTLFNQYFDKNIKPEMLIKVLCNMYNLYKKYEIDLNVNLFYASLFCQLNKSEDIDFIEYLIRNKIIPINEKLGFYFIMKAKCFKNKKNYRKCFNLGIDILMNECNYKENNIDEIIQIVNNINNIEDSLDFILEISFKNFI